MKKKIRMYEDAKYQAERRGIDCSDGYVDGYAENNPCWGKEAEAWKYSNSMFNCLAENFDEYLSYWAFEDSGDSSLQDDMFRYGTILTDVKDLMELLDPNNFVRITIVAYNHKVYYVKRVNDEIEILKELKT